jgi:RNA polymerase sigma factor (sigma-70 family)
MKPVAPGEPDELETSASPADDLVAGLVEQIRAGIDVEASFERLYKHFHPKLIHYFTRRGIVPERAEELTQDAFLSVFRNIGTFERRGVFTAWLFEIVRNIYINELRRMGAAKRDGYEKPLEEELGPDRGDRKMVAPALVSPAPSPLEEVEHREQVAALREALETLPPQMGRCVFLRLYHGLKYREVAATMNVSLDTVKAHLGQATVRLRKLLQGRPAALTDLVEDLTETGSSGGGEKGGS